jgi:hypothetical integral membrane protein (TIGR02206 family)
MSEPTQFSAFGPSHLTVLVVFAIGAAVLVWVGRHQTDSQARLFGRVFATAILVFFGIAWVYKLIAPALGHSVPLQLCDLAELAAVCALWSHRTWAFTLTYFWGLPLSSQALLTPDLHGPDFPGHSFVTFFALHVLIVWAAIYLTWGRRMHPDWRDYRFAVIATLTWGGVTLAFNMLAGTDYGYLTSKPVNGSVLDALGPWPYYVFAEVVIVAVIWALMTWPWNRKRRDRSGVASVGMRSVAAA